MTIPKVDTAGDDVLFLAWGAIPGRSAELAASLGASSVCLYPPSASRRPSTAVRYMLSTLRTIRILARRRPEILVVTNPPLLLSLGAVVWSRVVGGTVVLDSHPGAFGAMGDRMGAALLPVHRWLAPKVAFSLVAAPFWQEIVESWGGTAMVLHEAPGPAPRPRRARHSRLRVLYVGTFAQDEPIEALLGAARAVHECDIVVTGDLSEAPARITEAAPPNVHFVGFLDPHEYARQLEASDIVITLTTEPNSVMRAAYEAVYANRPLIVSDWPILRELFPNAVHARNDENAIAVALRQAIQHHLELVAQAPAARVIQMTRWNSQRVELAARLRAAHRVHRPTLTELSEPAGPSTGGTERQLLSEVS